MNKFKEVLGFVARVTAITLITCKVTELYNKYAHNEVARANLKNKIKKLNPFKSKYYEIKRS